VYRCDGCGLVMDRDLNAAVNILVAGSAPETQNAHRGDTSRGGQPGRATRVPAKCEPSVGGNVVSDLERVPARTPCKLQQSSLQRAKKGDAK
ncbi:zinc ribbon domain-containing protein, partial [Rothia mucilaginosa]|uniref:zinc ribbon domain-containing protein n=1 Tax=Rothia mucilaginosa TaxID=43675 RepID=UPI0034C68660